MRFDFHQYMRLFLGIAVSLLIARIKTRDFRPFNDAGIIRISYQCALRMRLMCVAYHRKQGFFLRFAVHNPVRVKYLMAAMLGIGLGKHHQFNIRRITPRLLEMICQVFNLIL